MGLYRPFFDGGTYNVTNTTKNKIDTYLGINAIAIINHY